MKKGVIFLLIILVVIGGYLYLNYRGTDKANYPPTYRAYIDNPYWRGGEVRPVVPTIYFTGRVRRAYEAAGTIPEVLDHLYCYCYCAENFGHKSLLTCFTDGHGAGCDICTNEAIRAQDLVAQGYTIKDIRTIIDREFYRPYSL